METYILLEIDIEVLREVGAGLWADFTRYLDTHNIPEGDRGPAMTVANQVFALYQRVLSIKTRTELDCTRGGFDFARSCLKALEEADNSGQPT